jgi:hypothetical protein
MNYEFTLKECKLNVPEEHFNLTKEDRNGFNEQIQASSKLTVV